MKIPWLTKYIKQMITKQVDADLTQINRNVFYLRQKIDALNDKCRADDAAALERQLVSLAIRITNLEKGEKRADATIKLQGEIQTIHNFVLDSIMTSQKVVKEDLADLRESHGNTLYKLNKTVKGLGELYRSKNEKPKKTKN